MQVDLHVHTSASDGADSPAEIVGKAKALGLRAIAITDHDTLEGIEQAIYAGQRHKIEIIPGIELGAECQGADTHILGYLVELYNRKFLDKLKLFREARIDRIEKMIENLRNQGLDVELNRVMAISGPGSIGRPHLATALVEAGVVTTISEAFCKHIGASCPAYVPRYKIKPVEAVRLILSAGGMPVLAHPGLTNSDLLIKELKDAGLAGLEAYHPAHSPEQTKHYCTLARENGLIITGGSDYHSCRHKTCHRLGMRTVSYSVVTGLKKRKFVNNKFLK